MGTIASPRGPRRPGAGERAARAGSHPERAALAMVVAVVAVQAAILARGPFLPFVDLPQHVALAQLVAHRQEAAVEALFEVRLFPQVNVLHLLLAVPLLGALPELAAERLIVVLYLVAMGWGLWTLTRALGTSAWSAVLALLFTLHFNLMWGFMSFCLGIPVLIVLFARLAGELGAERSGRRAMLVDAALWLLLSLAHVLVLGFALGALALRTIFMPAGRRGAGLVATAPALVLTGAWSWWSRLDVERLIPATSSGDTAPAAGLEVLWHGIDEKLAAFGWSLNVVTRAGVGEWLVLGAVALCAAWLLVWERRDSPEVAGRAAAARRARRWLRLVALLAVVLFAGLPYGITDRRLQTYGIFLLYHRFLVLAPLVLLPTLVWARRLRGRAFPLVLVGVLHVTGASTWHGVMSRAAGAADGLDDAIAAIPGGKIVKSLIYTPFAPGSRYQSFLHAASYYQARKLGEVDQSFALLPVSPVHYRDPARPHLSRFEEHLARDRFDWRRALLYDYILLYDRDGEWARSYAHVPFPRLYARNGWVVMDVETARETLER